MIYRFKIVSEETDKFRREIEIDPEESFMALRNAILDSVGYTKDEISTFFICDDDWKRQDEVAIEDFGSSSDQDLWLMDDTRISELIEEEGQKIEFVFDGLTERSFFMELKEILTGKNSLRRSALSRKAKPRHNTWTSSSLKKHRDQSRRNIKRP